MMINREAQIFADGACQANPRPGRWGIFLSSEKSRSTLGREPGTTNNRMEITSAIRSVEDLNRLQVLR